MLRRAIEDRVHGTLRRAGWELRRIPDTVDDDYANLIALDAALAMIPGMISPHRGRYHYLMAYSQSVRGDILEIGAWQGRNTCYLAAACRDSDNGIVHALDNFKGNPNNASFYAVGRKDLSDLEDNFRRNVETVGLANWVQLHAADIDDVTLDVPLRLLFVDGEHTYDAVASDLEKFGPLVVSGGLVVFDDYTPHFEGLVAAVQEWADRHAETIPVKMEKALALRVR